MSDDAVEIGPVAIEGVGFSGEGWWRDPERGFVSVPHAWPGDVVVLRRGPFHRGRAFAEVIAWHVRSSARVDPGCSMWDQCSGCALRHVSREHERGFKLDAARQVLARYGPPGADAIPLEVVGADAREGHRGRGRFSVEVDEGGVRVGLRAIGLDRRVLDLRSCPAQSARFREALAPLAAALDASPALAREVEAIEVRTGHDEAAIALVTPRPGASVDLGVLQRAGEAARVVVVAADDAAAALPVWLEPWGVAVQAPLSSWIHATPALGERLAAWVMDLLGDAPREAALDLCCGVGTMTAWLSTRAARVVAVDLDHRAVAALAAAAHEAGATGVEARAGRLSVVLRKLLARGSGGFEVALVNPMRRQLGDAELRDLPALGVREVVYLGPAPASAARDAAALAALGYRVQRGAVIDLHPATAHFMLGLHLLREGAATAAFTP